MHAYLDISSTKILPQYDEWMTECYKIIDYQIQRKAEMKLKQTDLRRVALDFEMDKWKVENEERLSRIEKKSSAIEMITMETELKRTLSTQKKSISS